MSKPKTIQTSGVLFSYWEHGPADGTPVLLLHGFPYAANTWDGVVAELQPNKRKLRLFVLSMRGYGETTVLQENLLSGQEAALAHDVLAFADALQLQRFFIVGHDWGARAGFDVSALTPERVIGHLGLSSPYVMYDGRDLPPKQVQSYWYQWYFQTAQGEKALRTDAMALCDQIWRAWSPGWKFSRREFTETAAYWRNPQFATVVLDSYRHRWGNSLGKPAYAALQDQMDVRPKAKISVPTLFGFGTDDHCVLPEASEEQKKYFSGWYERVPIKGAGHSVPQEDPGSVAKLFDRLWKRSR
ncbi:MAG TPA: alpha/beta hydrolase [Acidobacteriaceae bacterium]|nr:alpha/beta hydrolase [Acidobacteriaceae bacterium]